MSKDGLWYIELHGGTATAGVYVKNGKIVETAPILRWAMGKPMMRLLTWPKLKKATWIAD